MAQAMGKKRQLYKALKGRHVFQIASKNSKKISCRHYRGSIINLKPTSHGLRHGLHPVATFVANAIRLALKEVVGEDLK